MDLLIDLIVYLIKQATQSSRGPVAPQNPRESERQRVALAQQIQAMKRAIPSGQSRPRPAPSGGRTAKVVNAGPAQRAVISLPKPKATAVAASALEPAISMAQSHLGLQPRLMASLRLPFLMGEVLAPPLALREVEF